MTGAICHTRYTQNTSTLPKKCDVRLSNYYGFYHCTAITPIVRACVCLVWTRYCSSQDSFYFDPAPVSQVVVEGEDVRLRCDVSSRQFIKFYWTLNDRTLSNTSRRYQDGSDLCILSVNRTLDAGPFRCVAVNVSTGIAVRSGQAQLTVYCKLYIWHTNSSCTPF